ncbi:MAG: hypothetical protein LBN39_04330 [Planctomycetaceae bacterium]|jgi:hypothetical protein|nr:hypothetical protein [Planctomycetaceae bacterium]
MAIHVVCPGCLKRFQVSDRFAGMKGPCPNCKTVIDIPKAAVKVHGGEEFDRGGKTATGKLILKPLERLNMDFNPFYAAVSAAGVIVVYIIAFVIGSLSLSAAVRDTIGSIGLFFAAFPLSVFGYQVLRDREQLFILTGFDLYKLTGICAAAYAVLWLVFEWCAWYMSADVYFIWVYFGAFACIAMCVTHAVLDINVGSALLHYFVFAVPVILLRGTMNCGWLWNAVETVRNSNLPPAPYLPGM